MSVGKDARKIPGREKGGGVGHKFVTARVSLDGLTFSLT